MTKSIVVQTPTKLPPPVKTPKPSPLPKTAITPKTSGGRNAAVGVGGGGASAASATSASITSVSAGGGGQTVPGGTSSGEKHRFVSGLREDDDINDVAAMGGVNLQEESQRILASSELVSATRSCGDDVFLFSVALEKKITQIGKHFYNNSFFIFLESYNRGCCNVQI